LLELIDKSIEKDHNFFISKYFSSAHQKLTINQEEYKELNENLFKKADTLKTRQQFIDYVYESINDFSLLQYFDYLLLIGFTYQDFDKHIDKDLFEYKFNKENIDERKDDQKLFFRRYKHSNKEQIRPETYYGRNEAKEILSIEYYLNVNKEHYLSPGEYLILLIQLWLMHAKKKDTNMRKKLRILLLDEPDAYMHPNLIKHFIDLIQGNDLNHLKLHIIMTTHNPMTVNFLDIKNIYELKYDKKTEQRDISPIKNKSSLIHNLSNNLFYIKEKFKIVFIEGQNGTDIQFYEFVFDLYKKIANINREIPIKFQSMGSRMFRQLFEKKTIKNNDNHNLDEFLFGINDGDYNIKKAYEHFGKKKDFEEYENFFLLDRYHIENYIYDPINYYFAANFLLQKNGKSLEKKKNCYYNKVVDFFAKIKDLNTIEKFLLDDKSKKLEILNEILEVTNDYCLKEMTKNNLDETKKKFLNEFDLNSFEDEKLKKEILVDFKMLNNVEIQLKYYPVLLYFPRRELSRYFSDITNDVYNKVFNSKTSSIFEHFLKETNKLFRINDVHFNPIAYYFALKLFFYSNNRKDLVERDKIHSLIQRIYANNDEFMNTNQIEAYLDSDSNNKEKIFKEIISNTESIIFEKIDDITYEKKIEILTTDRKQEMKQFFLIRKILTNNPEIKLDEFNRLKKNICDKSLNFSDIECFENEKNFENYTDDNWNALIQRIKNEFKSSLSKLQVKIIYKEQQLELNELFLHEKNHKFFGEKLLSGLNFNKQIYVIETINAFNESGFLIDSCLFDIMESISNEL